MLIVEEPRISQNITPRFFNARQTNTEPLQNSGTGSGGKRRDTVGRALGLDQVECRQICPLWFSYHVIRGVHSG